MMKVNRLAILMLLSVVGSFAFAQSDWTGEVLVHRVSDTSGLSSSNASRMLSLKGGSIKQRIAGPEIFVLTPPAGVSVADYMAELKASGGYKVVAPNQYAMPAATSNDPELNNQWHLTQISAKVAWNYTTGSSNKTIAIVDSGVDSNHPDLAPNLVSGYNSIQNLAQSAGGIVADVHTTGHGTRCMGIAVAKGNNGIGISGVGWNLKGMPIRVTNQTNGVTTLSELIEGATWAIDHGADVVSVSYDQVANEAVETLGDWAMSEGAMLVWAAGNTATNLNTFDHPSVIIVGATDRNEQKLATSSFGQAVDIFAPGSQIFTTEIGGGYGVAPQGTSFATPQVAATIGLMMSRNPLWSPEKIERQLKLTTYDLGTKGVDTTYSFGRLNAGLAVWNPDPQWRIQDLTLPAGVTSAVVVKMNEAGMVLAKPTDGSSGFIFYDVNGVPTRVTNNILTLKGMNSSGVVVGTGLSISTNRRGFSWTPGVGISYHVNTLTHSSYSGINDSGDIIGADETGTTSRPFIIRNGVKTLLFSTILGGAFNGQNGFPSSINNAGNISIGIANVGGQAGYVFDAYNATRSFNFSPASQLVNFNDLSENGSAVGFSFSSGSGQGQPVLVRYNALGNFQPFGAGPSLFNPPAIADTSRTASLNNRSEIVGSYQSGGVGFFNDSIRAIDPSQFIDNSTLNYTPDLGILSDINERGDIGSSRDDRGSDQPIVLRRNRDVTLTMGIGQISTNPTYLGTIPPVVAVQFGDEAGNFNYGGTQFLPYQGATGRLLLQIPQAVGSTFRMRIQCSPLVTPGYYGCGYLSKIVPPLNQPAWPLDAYGQDPLTLVQGDCDLDNEIGPGDFELVVSKFGLVDGDNDFNPQVDVDADGEIGPGDFEIIVENFGLAGD